MVGADFDAWPEEKREMWNENVEEMFSSYNLDMDKSLKRCLDVGRIQALSIPMIAALDESSIELEGNLLTEQIEYGAELGVLTGCSVHELIAVLCYCSLRKKGKEPIHFIALYHEFTGMHLIFVHYFHSF